MWAKNDFLTGHDNIMRSSIPIGLIAPVLYFDNSDAILATYIPQNPSPGGSITNHPSLLNILLIFSFNNSISS
jgi:hypothetical protein